MPEKQREPWMSAAQEEFHRTCARGSSPILVFIDFRFLAREAASGVTFRRDAPKAGRNDACPCGSGKKYKQCSAVPKLH